MERRLLSTIGFRLNPVTLVHYADWYTRQWDAFATQCNLHQFCDSGDISFRTFTFSSYQRFRVLYQLIDAIAIDFESHLYERREIVAALLFFVIGSTIGMMVFPNNFEIAAKFSQYAPILENNLGITLTA